MNCVNKYKNAVFVTNYNQNNYLANEEQTYLENFPNNKSLHNCQYDICE